MISPLVINRMKVAPLISYLDSPMQPPRIPIIPIYDVISRGDMCVGVGRRRILFGFVMEAFRRYLLIGIGRYSGPTHG